LDNLRANAISRYKETTEYGYIKKKQEEIDMVFRDNLTAQQKELVEDCVFELGLIADREAAVVYRQGLRDCVRLLKNLGVLT
jgi:hypothetical protein